jgi:hypothetical protein
VATGQASLSFPAAPRGSTERNQQLLSELAILDAEGFMAATLAPTAMEQLSKRCKGGEIGSTPTRRLASGAAGDHAGAVQRRRCGERIRQNG